MKKKITILMIAAMLLAVGFTACTDATEASATPDSAATLDSPATKDEDSVLKETAADAEETTQSATSKEENKKETQPTAKTDETKSVQDNIPADNITGANVNPNIYYIQGNVAAEISALAVQDISLSQSEIKLGEGEKAELTVEFNPVNAAIKTCDVSVDNSNVTAKLSGKALEITAKKKGEATVTVTSHNGRTATCRVEVIGEEITDDTVLSHSELCTSENAQRWCDEITAYCSSLGLKQNAALSGETVVLRSSEDKAAASFNSYLDRLISSALSKINAQTGGSYAEYEFNSALELQGSEFNIVITLSRIRTEG